MTTRRYASPLVNVRLRMPLGLLAVGLAFFDLLAVIDARPSTTYRVEATIPLDVSARPNTTANIMGQFNHGTAISIGATPAPAASNDRVAQALALANSLVGSIAFDKPTQICDRFVARIYGYRSSGEDSAYIHYIDLRNRGLIHATSHPPAGALVFFGPSETNGFFGHVMVSRGDDTAYSNAVAGGIGITTIDFMTRNSGPYLGWADGPTGFPRGV